mgnify:CR=1 FL=1
MLEDTCLYQLFRFGEDIPHLTPWLMAAASRSLEDMATVDGLNIANMPLEIWVKYYGGPAPTEIMFAVGNTDNVGEGWTRII